MKATGIVRRIDDLGRVVIPKEIRRTMRIREGDPLEIYTDNNGEVIFKKYSPIGELAPFAAQYAEALGKAANLPVLICDKDHCIACAGVMRKEVLERRVTRNLEEIMEQRMSISVKPGDHKKIQPLEGVDRFAAAVFPIISAGDLTGAVVLLQGDTGSTQTANESDLKLAQVAASFLGKQMEE